MIVLYAIRNRIQTLYRTNPVIHVSVSINRPRISEEDREATIIGVYPNFFQIDIGGERYTVQYKDILTNTVRIVELDSTYTG